LRRSRSPIASHLYEDKRKNPTHLYEEKRKNPGKIVCLRASEKLIGVLKGSEKLIGVLKGDFLRLGSPKPFSTLGSCRNPKMNIFGVGPEIEKYREE
jgi:hypothetical protein